MSQLETLMLMTLGFAVAALIALFMGRAIWRYAIGLGKKRLERDSPKSVTDLQTDRDRLRAEYAILSRKLEMRLDELKTRLAEQTAEVSRNRNRIDHLIGEIKRRDALVSERDQTIEDLKGYYIPLEKELAERTVALQEAHEDIRGRDDELETLRDNLTRLRQEASDRERELALLRADAPVASGAALAASAAAVPAGDDPEPGSDETGEPSQDDGLDAAAVQERLKLRIDQLTDLSSQIEAQRAELLQSPEDVPLDGVETIASLSETEESPAKPKPGKAKRKAVRKKKAKVADEAVEPVDAGQRSLERQLAEAERETAKLQAQLENLDADWAAKLREISLDDPDAAEIPDEASDTGEKPGEVPETETPEKADDPVGDDAAKATDAASGDDADAVVVEDEPREDMAEVAEAEDEAENDKSDKAAKPDDADAPGQRVPAIQNVISLAARIRALKKGGA